MYPVCEETNVSLFIDNQKIITFMCTPENLKELAMGHLYTRNLIEDMEDIGSIRVCNSLKNIYITSEFISMDQDLSLNTVLSSSCGSSPNFNLKLDQILESRISFDLETLKNATMEMFKLAVKHQKTGGMHSCAVYCANKEIIALEDVGRHNAVDKIIGACLIKHYDLRDSALISTGRISTDMILKCAAAEIPVVVTRSIPTSSALELAKKTGITVVGRIMASEPIIYLNEERILK
ncbi:MULTISPECIES: formate dehydrogenase accessory sulfurtransferase FdhD [Psychrilyobacter]|uniref:Formate dehydrogenase accessory sulfurtransferase FdhD n=1 Tax=Psychrilyobacter piezotolerans TaxID=2293438 RepID=A0ABX9KIT0_9FUSO|nr:MULTISPECIES: formate dehydrogenase accessory sulfurtransferase FdhD [Psychrilyobacter]MCS5421145.1 formate dehydrogenase accessory sulfurtransferase FdhD [Psychrilyobacter sp. S5]NDI77083.1 formate dehydrogenase accessory sulfurtransferase FdhD [Psychrilyobacter piezotolerans]RDE64084.1 formate dehydrogenase accessory sulfurtransferase FdhD [Psychrilyobacter sp. S5]REI42176.1 formate dehydrogenase accessory sulfurtransferase FdhD [Psychrilyobacter piezotolerans]